MSLEELRKKRLKWVEANRENGFEDGIKHLLADLYPDNAHFIYELLQNAEDAKATEVRFILKEDGVEFEHNGGRLFSDEDVEAITSIGISTKKDDPTNIGKFGVGFKAVFAYTETPEVASGEYHFRIRDLVVPDTNGLAHCDLGEKETRFSFPFNNPEKAREKARAEIERNLRRLNESTLLFLSNIRKIEYLLPDSTLGFLKRRETDGSRIEILVQHPKDSKPASVFFLRFEKTVNVIDDDDKPKSCRIAVAFALRNHQEQQAELTPTKWRIAALTSKVSIYFPAEKETSNLHFHLHAPFASTVARDSVRDCEANDALRDHLADLVSESMTAIRDQGLLTVGFLATLPSDKDNLSEFYKPVMNRLVKTFREEKLTPMKQGGHAPAAGVYRGRRRLSDLINDEDLATILETDACSPLWIANPPQHNQREDNFLDMLDIPEWKTENLVDRLSAGSETISKWLAKKSEEWHQSLYVSLNDFLSNTPSYPSWAATERKRKLSRLRIVRCSDGKYRPGGECYFPSDGMEQDEDFPRIAKGVYSSGTSESQQAKARDFLGKMGVREVGEAEEIEAILKRRYSCEQTDSISPDDDASARKLKEELVEVRKKIRFKSNFDSKERDIERFIEFLQKEPEKASLFSKYCIFQLESGKWDKPGNVFLDTPYLDTGLRVYYESPDPRMQVWYKAYGRKRALSSKYQESGIDLRKLREFATSVGVQTRLEVVETSTYGNPNSEYLLDVGGERSTNPKNQDFMIPGLEELFETPNEKLSKLVWWTMQELPNWNLKATYQRNWRHGSHTSASQLIHHLRNADWVPQKQKGQEGYVFSKPVYAVAEFLPDGYLFDPGWKWLEAIEFGKTEQDRKNIERRKQEQNTQDYQRRDTAAKELGFPSVEEAQEAKEMVEMKRKDPEGFNRWLVSNKAKAPFPTSPVTNPERRQERLEQQHANAPGKVYETRERSVRTTRGEIDPETWLRNQYTNDVAQMVCQICKKEMPFKKRDGNYYFEAVEVFSQEYFTKEHEAQFLALCPLCAAMYKEFIKREETAMKNLHDALKNGRGLEIPLELGELQTNLRFVESHRQDIKTILHQ